ncbi:serine hydrolase FSH [Halteromyces radiatus]|uniref:serine hydrolase FSH n=1 Tax=Halteromyces radiatus TaxID=101107 RepID=UPI00221F72B5|nr:serine hydrolase FSH [Halteromyces radiatus]KAI8096538.1 serine hydrolase FSH [Halteromyces radiatus]
MERKLRILCLHGMSQNAAIFRKKTAVIRKKLDKMADLVYITAPHLSVHPDHTSEALREAAADPTASEDLKPFGWWLHSEYQDPNAEYFVGFKESIELIKEVLVTQGPFDGVFGFSQGASFASMLTAVLENRTLLPEFIPPEFEHPPFRFAMVAASFIPNRPVATRIFSSIIKTPSIHMIGEKDSLILPEQMETLANAFENPILLRHTGGHVVPSNAPSRNEIVAFISKFT